MTEDAIYHLALTRVPQIGPVLAKNLINSFGTAKAVFTASKKELVAVAGISITKAAHLHGFNDWKHCEQEIAFCRKNDISILTINDKSYPQRLLQCFDPPTVLFAKGRLNANGNKMVSIVGTRSATTYGKQFTINLVETLAQHGVTIVSGLALGIDTIAHKCSVDNNAETIGVVAHGLHTIYPYENKKLATQMQDKGGLLTELWSGEQPDKHNFPTRNRLVAGLADAVVVVETDVSGGSMITAELAFGYNRDLFALPGRVTDNKSKGCNHLLKMQKAAVITSGYDLLEAMNWLPKEPKKQRQQRQLFVELNDNEKAVYDLLNQTEQLHVDQLRSKVALNPSALATALLSLEMQNLIISLPGNTYKAI